MGFDDVYLPAVRKAIACLLAHRHYEELDIATPLGFEKGMRNTVRRIATRPLRDRYFRKLDTYEPDEWNFFARF
jgi:hypothetical protein